MNEVDLGQWTDPYNRKFDYGPASADSTNNFKLTEVWVLPTPHSHGPLLARLAGGWEINSFTTWQSGEPFTQYCDCDNSFTGIGLDRADYIGGPIRSTESQPCATGCTLVQQLCVRLSKSPGIFRNSTRNQIRAPRYFDTDAALLKNTRIAGNLNLQLRGEAFNAFNNVNLGFPNSGLANPNGGSTITSAQPPRIIQISAKITF